MAKSPAVESAAVDFNIDPKAVKKAQEEIARIKLTREQKQEKPGGEK